NRKAHFSLLNIDAPPAAVAELERQMRLSTDVIRFLTVRVDEHEQGPSPMMRRAHRDEREGRGDRGDRVDRGGSGDRRPRRDRDRDRDFGPRDTQSGSDDVEPSVADTGEDE